MRLPNLCVIGVAALASTLAHSEAVAQVRTLQEALAAAYSNNPTLQTSRAQLRATDEGVPQALAGWRPTVIVSGTAGYGLGELNQDVRSGNDTTTTSARLNRPIYTALPTITQPIYRGGNTRASTNQADNRVFAQRGRLIASEQSVFNDTVSAYVNVIQSQQLNQLNINNQQVLARQLQATNDRFRVGEITRTDVAQAEAALAGAQATQQTSAGNLQTARANYRRFVGEVPIADQLIEPQPIKLPLKNQDEAVQLASQNNPNVIAALFDAAAARDAIDVAFSQLMPQLSIQTAGQYTNGQQVVGQRSLSAQVVLNASIPLYQGGAEYSRVRQARQTEQQNRKIVDDVRRQAIANATQSWETLTAARSTIESTRAAIRANQIALEGVQREAIVGSRTTLDVLNAEQALLNSRVTLVQNLSNLVTASYSLAAAIGRLTARDLNLNVPLYDETAYYNAVRQRLAGTGDYATTQPGR